MKNTIPKWMQPENMFVYVRRFERSCKRQDSSPPYKLEISIVSYWTVRAGPFDTDVDEKVPVYKWWTGCGQYDRRAAWLAIAK